MPKNRQSGPWRRAHISLISPAWAGARTDFNEQSRAIANEARVLLAVMELVELHSKLMLAISNLELVIRRRSNQRQ